MAVVSLSYAQQPDNVSTEERLRRLEQRMGQYEQTIAERDARIRELETERKSLKADTATPPIANKAIEAPTAISAASSLPKTTSLAVPPTATSVATSQDAAASPKASTEKSHEETWGQFTPGVGFTVANTKWGSLELSLYSYMRYLNSTGNDDTYIDRFGKTQVVKGRNDIQVSKAFLYTKGWVFDPRLRYLFYVWASSTGLGTNLNTLVAGNVTFRLNDYLTAGIGVFGLPSTRSLEGQFPQWHRTDARLIADEYMRGSYTQGIFASGKITDTLQYMAGLGNNLSAFGVSASKLDTTLDTFAFALRWMPTTGEFGPRANIGDYEEHDQLATLFGVHFTTSTEDKQSQPGLDTPENTQVRLSDGSLAFGPNTFGPGISVNRLDYKMVSVNAGMKLHGFSLEGEAYYRQLSNFKTNVPTHIGSVNDEGFQLSGSTMLIPNTLQLYANGSKIFGENRDPWDVGVGLNWWPFKRRGLRLNSELMYVRHSPVGNIMLPYQVGSNGPIFMTNVELAF
jgi:hypothetical protein